MTLLVYMRTVQVGLLGCLAVLLTVCPALAAIQLETVVSGLDSPLYVTNAGDATTRLFILEQAGRIKVLQPGATVPTVFLDITSKVLSGGERGLLGLAFHADYNSNRRFFVNYTRQTDGATVVAEYHASVANPNIANATETVILVIPQPFANHNGGMIEFGPDGYLYIGVGDGGSANDPGNRAQNINELLGKILRIDIDHPNGSIPYSSPASNPFFGATPGRDEIYAIGFRNPWRFSFDLGTGQLVVGDVGQGAREEIDIVTLGGNYGWRVFEGSQCTNLDPSLCDPSNFAPPIAEYSHAGGRCSITGGYVYRGTASTLPVGTYLFADFCTAEIFTLQGNTPTLLLDTNLSVASFGQGEDGEMYVVNLGGSVHRIVNVDPPPPCTFSRSPASQSFAANGGTGSVNVTAPDGCDWTAVSNAGWITITSGQSGSGNGTVAYAVTANTSTSSGTGTMTVAGQAFTVTQAGTPSNCTYSMSPRRRFISAGGGLGSVSVTTSSACGWTAVSKVGWITITSGNSGAGNGTVTCSVAANTSGRSRRGAITIAGRTFTVGQSR